MAIGGLLGVLGVLGLFFGDATGLPKARDFVWRQPAIEDGDFIEFAFQSVAKNQFSRGLTRGAFEERSRRPIKIDPQLYPIAHEHHKVPVVSPEPVFRADLPEGEAEAVIGGLVGD